MRLIISFLLSLILYMIIILFFIDFLKPLKSKPQVLIHTAIIVPKTTKNKNSLKNTYSSQKTKSKVKVKNAKVSPKKITKKSGTKTNVKKGGSVSFNDIFKNVKTNVPTTPVKLKQSLEISRFKGLQRIENDLNKIKKLNINITFQNESKNTDNKEQINKIVAKIGEIWYKISNIPGEYAKIRVTKNGNNIDVVVLNSNLSEQQQNMLISLIKQMNFDTDFDIKILFQTKVNK